MSTWLQRLADWFDHRTGARRMVHDALYENVPGGSRWIYVTGSMLVCAFVTQAITGIFLWMYYSAGSQNAWESVYYIQNEVQGGWLLRGVHHYMAQAMVVLLPLHLLQVVFAKAYVAPREINYWLGLILMLLVLGLGLTGYLLPWDQKGYWATKVATELMSLPPGGASIQKLVVGGSEYGHLTLTRFFTLHAGVLPALLVMVLAMHVALFRKHGVTAESREDRPDEHFWPMQVLKDAAACVLMLAAVFAIVLFRQAELGPPAEPTQSYGAARPEWYFLFLFQLLKKAPTEFIGAIVIPGAVMAFLFAMPLLARIRYMHIVNVTVVLVLMMGAGYLTYEAISHDNYDRLADSPPAEAQARKLWQERVAASRDFKDAKRQAHEEYERVRELIAYYGIPREGVSAGLIEKDPEIQGPRIFLRSCASCHSYLAPDGSGIAGPEPPPGWDGETPYGAPNLYAFASRRKLLGFLDPERIATPEYFGATIHAIGDDAQMVPFVLDTIEDPQSEELQALVALLSAEAELVDQREMDAAARADGTFDAGLEAMVETYACTDCHKFQEHGELGYAPDLTGYGSYDWLYAFIRNPEHERFYPETNDRMPKFAEFPDQPLDNLLSAHQIDMLVRWIRGDERDLSKKLPSAANEEEVQPQEAPAEADAP